ncbi:hypothetical protein [Streptomyces sp. NBC_01669]|uniref:hypothetical protein n=1 Tax=Streptomyces sp. NBC_01669 TaxID=2975909 RepID=UPI0022570E92|nr:hypothetical protein [Streptomyces sp. NBC_01669]MCX4537550.1 hypothetical protein [Streptomyces sp. NBC_01669]
MRRSRWAIRGAVQPQERLAAPVPQAGFGLVAQEQTEQVGIAGVVFLSGRVRQGVEADEEQPYLDEAMEAIRRHMPAAHPMMIDVDDVADFDDFWHHAGYTDEPHAHAFRAPF